MIQLPRYEPKLSVVIKITKKKKKKKITGCQIIDQRSAVAPYCSRVEQNRRVLGFANLL